jgi:glyoxylate reductase
VKVLSTRKLPGPAWDELRDVEVGPIDRVRDDVEAVIVANEPVDLDLLPSLRLVANYSVGYDRIDVEACRARGVAVTNTPGVLDDDTADLAFALLLAARRRLTYGDRFVRNGEWTKPWNETPFLGHSVSGATLGIVGLGRIGSAVARRAEAFGMRVVFHSRSRGIELDDLLRQSDAVSLHVPLTPETEGLISRERLALLRDDTTLVNTARGAIVDEEALVDELVSGRISAGLDVFAHEPSVPVALLDLPNVALTPHLGSATVETREAMTRVVVDNILAAERGEPLPNPV